MTDDYKCKGLLAEVGDRPTGKRRPEMDKKYIAELTIEERKRLDELIDTGKAAKHKIRYDETLLLANLSY